MIAATMGRMRGWVQRGLDRRAGASEVPLGRSRGDRSRVPPGGRTRIIYLTHYFPPEGNAPAARVYEMCRRWVRDGHEVTVVTCVPNHPSGVVYDGYRNWPIQQQRLDGIRVIRVWTFLAANRGKHRRAINFLSYMLLATILTLLLRRRDVLIATSPQFLCGWAGVIVTALRRIPFILEVRDIWPESITSVGVSRRNLVIWLLERMEQQMYASAYRIVTVGDGYKRQLARRRVPVEKIEIVTNGVDRERFALRTPRRQVRARYGLGDGFVCAYVGTIGLACGLSVALRAAKILVDKGRRDITIALIGDGAMRRELELEAKRLKLNNVVFTGRLDRQVIPDVLTAVDACLVHLRQRELFTTVLPSKMYEAAAMARPIILGVKGSAAEFVESAGCGICIEPENEHALVRAIETLAGDRELTERLGSAGHRYVHANFDRDQLARQYFSIIRDAIDTCPIRVRGGKGRRRMRAARGRPIAPE